MTDKPNPAFAPVDLLTAELVLDSSIYEGFSAAIMVKGQPRMVALCREYGDAVQLMNVITQARRSIPSEEGVGPDLSALTALVAKWREEGRKDRAFVDGGGMNREMAREFLDRAAVENLCARQLEEALAALLPPKAGGEGL